jgi:hypothetical protein
MSTFNEENSIKLLNHMLLVCFSDDKIAEFRQFITEKEPLFENFSDEEYELRHHNVYLEFLELVERSIDEECAKMRTTKEDVFRMCKDYENVPSVDVFNTIITLTTAPEPFFDLMKDRGKQDFVFGTINTWKSYFAKK